MLVPLWFLCALMHARDVWLYELLAPGKDIGVDDVNLAHDIKQERHKKKKMERKGRRLKRSRPNHRATEK